MNVWRVAWGSPLEDRLRATIAVERRELETAGLPDEIRAAVGSTLNEAGTACGRGEVDAGWRLVHLSRRQRASGLEAAALAVAASELAGEAGAGKFRAWRIDAVRSLLEPLPRVGLEEARERVRKAMELRDDHFDNTYFKTVLTRQQMVVAGLWAAALLVALVVLFFVYAPVLRNEPPEEASTLVLALLMGGLGGSFSALRGLSQISSQTSIPERIGSRWITSLRPLVGAIGAAAFVMLFRSGLVRIGAAPSLGLLLGASFAAGFSERIVTGLMERVQPPSGTG